MREPKAFSELETKIGQQEKPAQKPAFEFKDDDEKADFIMDFYNNDYAADGFQTKKLGKGLYATNHHLGDPEAEPEEISAKDLGKFFDESNLPNDTRPMEYYKGWREKHPLSKMQEAQKPVTSQFVFPDDPTDPDLERGYGPGIKDIAYRGEDIQKAKDAGWSDDQIIDALIDQGYDDEEVIDFVTDYDPRRFKDPKTNPARSPEAWEEKAKNQEALRRKFDSTIFPPTKSMPYWTFDDPYWGGTRKFKTEEEALDYAGESLEKHNDWVSKEATRLINDFRQGKVTTKDLKQFGRSEYVADILTYLLGKIK